jgi:hypothetical protein
MNHSTRCAIHVIHIVTMIKVQEDEIDGTSNNMAKWDMQR